MGCYEVSLGDTIGAAVPSTTAAMLDAVLASVHHLFVFSLVAVLFAELVLASSTPDAARLRQLGRLDSAYGLLSMGIIAAGFLRAAYGAKGWSFYAHNPVFWTKIGIFVCVGLLLGWLNTAMVVSATAKFATENAGKVIAAKVDVDSNQNVAAKYNIRQIPTLLWFKDGNFIGQTSAMSKDGLLKKLESL